MKLYYIPVISFYIFTFLKQFYILPSGSIGIGDMFLAVSGVFLIIQTICSRKRFFYKIDIPWYVFIIAVCIINGFYYCYNQNGQFLLFTLYWMYVTMAIWIFRTLASEQFLFGLGIVCQINLLVQTIIYFLGKGRYFHENWGGSRFMGTFNDPNQFAFFIFTMLLILVLIYLRNQQKKYIWLFWADAVFLIGVSKSTGVFTGLLTLIVLLAGCLIWKNYKKSKCKTLWNISLLLGAVFIMMALYYIWPKADFDISLTDYTLLDRIRQKIWKFSHGNLADLLYDRSAERLVLHPKYLLYGAGEGMFERFLPGDYVNQITPGVFDVVRVNEIHSSLFSVWFSYGIIPLLGLLYWGGKNIRFCDKWQLIVVMALIVESFSLMNCRQPFFWFIIIFASCYKKMGRERQDKGGVFLN